MTDWVRKGQCNRCGDCCWGDNSKMLPEIQGTIEGACSALRCDIDGAFHCSIWGWHPYWEAGCKDWPGDNPSTLEYCGYKSCGFTYEAA